MSGNTAGNAGRLSRERQTIDLMIGMYCRAHHAGAGDRCGECRALFDYAMARLDRCRYGADKPTCAACPIHCYKAEMRQRVRAVMRYAGPRMLLRHPLLALRHQFDEWLARRKSCKGPRQHAEAEDRTH